MRASSLVDPTNPTDEELLTRIHGEDHQALGVLYDRYARLVFSIGIHVLQDEGQAEEMTQDVFVSIWRRAGSYRSNRAKVSTWIGSVAHHRAIDIIRRRQRDAQLLTRLAADFLRSPLSVDGLEVYAERSIERAQVHAALGDLPNEQREVILLAYFRGLTHTEIAEALGQPLGTVKTRIRLGMHKLKDRLGEDLRESDDG